MRAARLALVVALVVGALTACTGGGADITPAVSARLERDVRSVAALAADHRYGAALSKVRSLRTAVTEALAAGQLSGERATRIRASLDLVQHDLTALTPTPTPTAAPRIAPSSPRSTPAPSHQTEEQRKQAEEQLKKAEERRKKAAEEAEKRAEEAQKKAEEQQKDADEKQRDKEKDDKGDD